MSRIAFPSTEVPISNPSVQMTEPYVLIVPSYDGAVVALIEEFIEYEDNLRYLVGVVGSGNKAFGDDYIWTAKGISHAYQVPLVFDFEFRGTDDDVTMFNRKVELIGESEITAKA